MRKIFDFHGGIHPPENKHQSLARPDPSMRGIPAGADHCPCHSISARRPARWSSVGQRVLKGQLIAEPLGFVSVPVHAPTSGTIQRHRGPADCPPLRLARTLYRDRSGRPGRMDRAGRPYADYRTLEPAGAADTDPQRRDRRHGRRRLSHRGQTVDQARQQH